MNIHIYEIVSYLLICGINDDYIISLLKSNSKNIIMNELFYLDAVVCDEGDGPTSPLGPGGPCGPGGP